MRVPHARLFIWMQLISVSEPLRDVVLGIALLHLAILFSMAGLAKYFWLPSFTQQLSNHGLLPDRVCRPTAWGVVIVEIFLGIWLVSGIQYGAAAACASFLLLTFLIYHFALRVFGNREAPCGCLGGPLDSPTGTDRAVIAGDVLNLVVAVALSVGAFFVSGRGSNLYSSLVSALVIAAFVLALLTVGARQMTADRHQRPVGEIG